MLKGVGFPFTKNPSRCCFTGFGEPESIFHAIGKPKSLQKTPSGRKCHFSFIIPTQQAPASRNTPARTSMFTSGATLPGVVKA